MELNRNLANIKNSSSLTFGTINIVFISHVISHSSSFSVAQDNVDHNIQSKEKEHSFATYAYSYRIGLLESLLFVGLKTITNASGQMRQPYAHVTNESTQRIALLLLFFSLSGFKSPGGHAIYCRNTRVIKMQNVTLWIDL